MLKFALALLLYVQFANAQFSAGFQKFLKNEYGQDYANLLLRADLGGTNGSFGGGSSSKYFKLKQDPVILIHGIITGAGGQLPIRDFFENNGYEAGSIFATAYGPPGVYFGFNDTVLCQYVLQVRRLILAVSKYTKRPVNVVGYSLGSVMSRKAILGGRCVENNKYLGLPLTPIVSKFLSVVGANLGIGFCNLTAYSGVLLCSDPITGTDPKHSKIIEDINKFNHYEGWKTYLLASTNDGAVYFGNTVLNNADTNVTLTAFSHSQTILYTPHIQHELLSTGYLSQESIDIDAAAFSAQFGVNATGWVEQRARPPHHH